jgi:hypothetical protein
MKRWDVLTGRTDEKSGKTYWTKCGTAFEGDKGISIVFDALPVNGRCALFEPRPKADHGDEPRRGGGRNDSDIPF